MASDDRGDDAREDTHGEGVDPLGETIHDPESGAGGAPPSRDGLPEVAGDTIGPYTLLHRVGRGGMADVWVAEQSEPVQRNVALKIVRPGMDSAELVARFQAERQALAMMSHTSIAKVFDAGVTPRGRPFFALEHVPGLPITRFCDRHRLTIRERLELFIPVCEAVQHAHVKGVIHRDLKPSNVLVTQEMDRSVPKVIDFGIAKAMHQPLGPETVHTTHGTAMGTPAYMSPEQAMSGGIDVDVTTDIYALGVMLYELLCGSVPRDLTGKPLAEVFDILRSTDPPTMVARLAEVGNASDVAERRGTDERSLRRLLTGELQWILTKCMDTDRTRRYQAAEQLVREIRRYLEHRPVYAGPPSRIYQWQKFARRNPWPVSAVSVIGVLLVGFSLAMARQVRLVEREAETSEEVIAFLRGIFQVADPTVEDAAGLTARELVDRGAARIDELDDQPVVQARLLGTIADVYYAMGLMEPARGYYERAVDLADAGVAGDPFETAQLLSNYGRVLEDFGEYEAAEAMHRRAVVFSESNLGPETLETALAFQSLGTALYRQQRYDEAEELQERALVIRRAVQGSTHPDVGGSLTDLANIALARGELEDAERLYVEALDIRAADSSLSARANAARTLNNLGALYVELDDFENSRTHYERAIAIRESIYGPDHPSLANSVGGLAVSYEQLGLLEEAEAAHLRALELRLASLGEIHPNVGISYHSIAEFLRRQDREREALDYARRALATRLELFGPEHALVGSSTRLMGRLHRDLGEYEAALPYLERGLEMRVAASPGTLAEASSSFDLGLNLFRLGRYAEAEPLVARNVALREELEGMESRTLIGTLRLLGDILIAQGREAEGRVHRDRAEAISAAG